MREFFRSFVYAGNGMRVALKEERNLRFHLVIAFYVYLFSLFYGFSRTEYILITILVAGVMALELVNSAFERSVSRPRPERYMTAGTVKDIAAGAVLVFSIAAAACGVAMFWDTAVFLKIFEFFKGRPLLLLPLAASLAGGIWFVFLFGRKSGPPRKERTLD